MIEPQKALASTWYVSDLLVACTAYTNIKINDASNLALLFHTQDVFE